MLMYQNLNNSDAFKLFDLWFIQRKLKVRSFFLTLILSYKNYSELIYTTYHTKIFFDFSTKL